MWLFLVQCEQGHKEAAAAELKQMDKSRWLKWHHQYAQLLLGEITEAQLDAEMAKPGVHTDRFKVSLYAGKLSRLAGDETRAMACFRTALRFGSRDELEREATQHELDGH